MTKLKRAEIHNPIIVLIIICYLCQVHIGDLSDVVFLQKTKFPQDFFPGVRMFIMFIVHGTG